MTVLRPNPATTIDQDARRTLIRGRPDLDGIDFVEVLSNHAGTAHEVPGAPQQCTLLAHLLNRPVPADWDASNVRIEGGVREDPTLNPVRVRWAYPAVALVGTADTPRIADLPGVASADRALVAAALPEDETRDRAFVVRTHSTGDWSTYRLRLLDDTGVGAPPGLDAPLASAPFQFTVDCPSDVDCATVPDDPAPTPSPLPVDYLARDATALRTRLLDRLSVLIPGWDEHHPADPLVMLAELFAYLGDRLAYWQDAVAVEAYLDTARHRTSVRRHARLLGYAMHEGCAARTFLAFHTDTALTLPAGTAVTDRLPTGPGGPAPPTVTAAEAADVGGTVFETMHRVRLQPARNELELYAWSDDEHTLPAGTTAAYLSCPAEADPGLCSGDLLILVDRPIDGLVNAGDPGLRFPVRLTAEPIRHHDPLAPHLGIWQVTWAAADALPQPLPVRRPGVGPATAVALANIVVADHGATLTRDTLDPPSVPASGQYTPRLRRAGVAYVDDALPPDAPATTLLAPEPHRAQAAVTLHDGEFTWLPRSDLLAAGRHATQMVVEPDPAGVARLRFGDGVHGRAPRAGAVPRATYRVGGGLRGNVAAGRLVHCVAGPEPGRHPAVSSGASVQVWNPLPATGGTDPEDLEAVRHLAPARLRDQRRAVTSDDYADVAAAHPGVQRAVARRRWTGSWFAQQVTVDPVAGRAEDPGLIAQLAAALQERRMVGVDVEFARPVYVPVVVDLEVCVRVGFLRSQVARDLADVLSARVLRDGSRGFFHIDRFTFGQPLLLSDVVAAVMARPGVESVTVNRFARMGANQQASDTLRWGRILAGPREVLRCDTDPNSPETGRVDLRIRGGS